MPPGSITSPYCPLLSMFGSTLEECYQERCAWWIETNKTGHCAIFWLGLESLSAAMHKNGAAVEKLNQLNGPPPGTPETKNG